jgi:hypothetical protein
MNHTRSLCATSMHATNSVEIDLKYDDILITLSPASIPDFSSLIVESVIFQGKVFINDYRFNFTKY